MLSLENAACIAHVVTAVTAVVTVILLLLDHFAK